MDINKFIPKCKALVSQHINQTRMGEDGLYITPDDVYVVWFSKTLSNAKALLISNADGAKGLYYEATYNGDRREIYLDVYTKVENKVFDLGIKR